MLYWVIQRKGTELFSHGPYRSEEARDKRYENVSGGEVYKFNSFLSDPEAVRQEFRDEEVKKL